MTKEEFAIKYIEDNFDPINDTETLYDQTLDEVYPDCKVAGLTYTTSDVLKNIDPTAYRCGLCDWLDGEMRDGNIVEIAGEYWGQEADEVFDEITDMLEDITLVHATAEDFTRGKVTHDDFEEKPARCDFDSSEEYQDALSDWRDAAEELDGWFWMCERGELNGPHDTEEDAWADAAGVAV